MDFKARERCVELVYKIIITENSVVYVDNDLNYYLNSSKALGELYTLINENNKYEVNYVCGLFVMSESGLDTLEKWKMEYLQDNEVQYWNRCLTEFEMKESWLLEYNEKFIKNNFAKYTS